MPHVATMRNGLMCGALLMPLISMIVSGCQTLDDGTAANGPWDQAPRAQVIPERVATVTPTRSPITSASQYEPASYFNGTGQFIGSRLLTTGSTSERGNKTLTLNLVDVPVPEAAKTVLSDILAVKYTIDPAIKGKVTIQTPNPISKSEAADLFQSALRANGASVIDSGGVYRIVPVEQAAVGADMRLDRIPASGGQVGSHVQVVQLKYVAATEIRRILEPVAPKSGILQIDPARNTITLSGNPREIASMLDVIAIFDIDVMKGMSFALVPVRTSQPDVIADDLRTVFASDQPGPMAGMVRFIPNRELSAVLVVSPQREYLARAEGWVRRFDARAAGTEKQFFTYAVQNRRAQEVAGVLEAVFSRETGGAPAAGGTRNVAPQYREAVVQPGGFGSPNVGNSASNIGSQGGALIQASAGGAPAFGGMSAAPRASSAPRPAAARPPAVPPSNDLSQEPRIKLAVDEGKNAILIQASPADYRRVQRVLGTLDVMPNQVLIEVTIAEVTLNDELKFGLRWFLRNHGSSYNFSDDAGGAVASVFPGFSYALSLSNVSASLNALNQITNVNVVSSPSLTVMDNRTAALQIGDEVPITTQSAVSTLTTGAPIVNSVNYKDTGVILSMTPRINASGRIMLDLQQEVSTVVPTTTSGIDSPTIRQRRIRTSVVINNGESLVLGGLIQNNATLTRTQAPILGDLPIIGNAFQNKDNQINRTELMIIITPHLMRNLNEARRVTEEYRHELATFSPPVLRPTRNLRESVRRTLE